MNELYPGTTLYGYCNGYFGRDSYGEKRVIASGTYNKQNWVVVEERGYLNFASGFDDEDVKNWMTEEEYD